MILDSKPVSLAVLSLLLILFAGLTMAQSQISTTPGFLDAGNLSEGDEIEMSFFITVDAERNVTLDVEVGEPMASRLWNGDIPVEQQEYSQQDISDWIDVPDQITVDPSNEVDADFASGNYELRVGLEIPDDAEPGYHAAQLRFTPVNTQTGEGYGAGTITSSVPEFMFRVPGDARREIDLTNLEAIRTGESQVQLLATFENTGTVTVDSRGGEANVVKNGKEVGTVDIDGFTVSPGETAQVDATWSGEQGGEYQLEGTVNYITGQAYIGPPTGEFAITGAVEDAVEIEDGTDNPEQGEDSRPLWIVIMLLVVLGAIMYSMEIDPFWIIMALGFLGVASAILLTGLPNWIFALLVLAAAVVIYI